MIALRSPTVEDLAVRPVGRRSRLDTAVPTEISLVFIVVLFERGRTCR
jgi:hypothetical protein